MAAEYVDFKISPDGFQVEVDANGFTGGKCKAFTKDTLKKLGMVMDEKKKPEFFVTEHQSQTLKS